MDFIADIMIVLMALVLVAALALTAYSVYHSLRTNKRKKVDDGVPVGMIGWGTVALVLVISIPTLLIGSFTDMCLVTAGVMLLVAGGTVVYSKVQSARLRK